MGFESSFFFQAEDGIRDKLVTGVQTCALPIFIQNDGVRMPTVSIERLRFAEDTPYETTLKRASEPERVMAPEVAQTLRRALTGVVAEGTARRLVGTYKAPDVTELSVGGKTGTGDNRYHHFAAGGGVTSSHVVDRTATFVFYL